MHIHENGGLRYFVNVLGVIRVAELQSRRAEAVERYISRLLSSRTTDNLFGCAPVHH